MSWNRLTHEEKKKIIKESIAASAFNENEKELGKSGNWKLLPQTKKNIFAARLIACSRRRKNTEKENKFKKAIELKGKVIEQLAKKSCFFLIGNIPAFKDKLSNSIDIKKFLFKNFEINETLEIKRKEKIIEEKNKILQKRKQESPPSIPRKKLVQKT